MSNYEDRRDNFGALGGGSGASSGTCGVLLVERSRFMRDLMASVLQREHRVQTAATYEEARRQAREDCYDGIVVSVYPGDVERGTEVMAAVRDTASHEAVPILIVGGPFLERDCTFLVEEGADEVLQRPFVQSDLLAALDRVLQEE